MINFFRKIRQRLLTENKFSKYLVYAIGEIALVMIGILLALQVNNWNENRKLEVKSHNYIQRLKVDLDNMSEDADNSVRGSERRLKRALVALKALEAKELLPEQQENFDHHLSGYFKFDISIQNITVYNEMISSGDLGLIKNEWLRTAFADLSDRRDFIIELNQANHNAYKNNTEIIEKYVKYNFLDSTKIKAIYDFDAMANDDSFVNHISNQVYVWHDIVRIHKVYQRRVNITKDSILIELKKMKNDQVLQKN
ncbi:MAG: hypothetical protein HKN83_05140 [Gammaproteobacteria bacterium]|nr:hypothetical protein [Gammaproteobacteria bacterium]